VDAASLVEDAPATAPARLPPRPMTGRHPVGTHLPIGMAEEDGTVDGLALVTVTITTPGTGNTSHHPAAAPRVAPTIARVESPTPREANLEAMVEAPREENLEAMVEALRAANLEDVARAVEGAPAAVRRLPPALMITTTMDTAGTGVDMADGPRLTTMMTPHLPLVTIARAVSLAVEDPREESPHQATTMMIIHHPPGPRLPAGVDPVLGTADGPRLTTMMTPHLPLVTIARAVSLAVEDPREESPADAERAAEDAAAPHQATTMMIIHHPPGTAEMDGSEYGRLLPHGMKVPAAAAVPAAVAQYQASLEARVERAVVDFKYREWCHT